MEEKESGEINKQVLIKDLSEEGKNKKKTVLIYIWHLDLLI